MKKIVFLIVLMFALFYKIYSQGIELGKDTTFCMNAEKKYVGSNMSILGNNTNISFSWSCKYIDERGTLIARNILNDTNISNPYLISWPSNAKWIKLICTASINSLPYKDSIHVRVSEFRYISGYQVYDLNVGDSISLLAPTSGVGGVLPYKFIKWKPGIGLNDSTNGNTYAKALLDKTGKIITYSWIIEDSAGCEASNIQLGVMAKLPNATVVESDVKDNIYFIDPYSIIIPIKNEFSYTLFDFCGRICAKGIVGSGIIRLPQPVQSSTIYLLNIESASKWVKSYKIHYSPSQ